MRTIVFLLALLALGKVGYHEYQFRSAASDIIINAYRARAVTACSKQSRRQIRGAQHANWSQPTAIKMAIGKAGLNVYFWQVDSSLWNARFRNPYLFLSVDQAPEGLMCEFDIVNQSASIYRL